MDTSHVIDMDFTNAYGQRVLVVTCPARRATFALNATSECPCGHRI